MNNTKRAEALTEIPGYSALSEASRQRLGEMLDEMERRGLPPEMVTSGLRSTAALLEERESAAKSRIHADEVQEFLAANGGKPIARAARAVPKRETKAVAREHLHSRVSSLLEEARAARRKHEILSVRRDLLAVDQAYVRRTLGAEGEALCDAMNEWLGGISTRTNRGAL